MGSFHGHQRAALLAAYGQFFMATNIDPKVPLAVADTDPHPAPSSRRVRHWRNVVIRRGEVRQRAKQMLVGLGDKWLDASSPPIEHESADEAVLLLIRHLADLRSDVRAMAKNPYFSDEHEQRVTVETFSRTRSRRHRAAWDRGLHMRLVAGEDRWGGVYERADLAPRLPIRAVRLGPNVPESAHKATRWLLLAHGYPLDAGCVGDDPVEVPCKHGKRASSSITLFTPIDRGDAVTALGFTGFVPLVGL